MIYARSRCERATALLISGRGTRGSISDSKKGEHLKKLAAFTAAAVIGLTLASSAVAFDCIRVSSSLQGLQQSTQSGNWLLFDLSSAQGVAQTFQVNFGAQLAPQDAACFAAAYAATGQPAYWALGIGVAGGKSGKSGSPTSQGARAASDGFGVIAWHNKNVRVLSNGTGIDHLDDSPIIGAVFAAAGACNIALPG